MHGVKKSPQGLTSKHGLLLMALVLLSYLSLRRSIVSSRRHLRQALRYIKYNVAFHSRKDDSDEELRASYLRAMRLVPSPVVVVTTSDGSVKRGVTCSSFSSVSSSPPIISFGMMKPSRMHNLLLVTKKFAVHILSEVQVHHSVHFSQPIAEQQDQFDGIHHSLSTSGLPVLPNCCAVMEASTHSVHNIGDHHVWYGQVLSISSSTAATPLLYYARTYRSVGDETFMKAFETATLAYEDWTHKAHLRMAWNYIISHGAEEATPLIRTGIKRYNEKNSDKVKRGYHETITIFFIHMLDQAIRQMTNQSEPLVFEEFLTSNRHLMDPHLLFKYYSQEHINSLEAKYGWVEPDLQPLP